jgi:DNA polymerase I-like protein with 3'-5' exonuclease and polymerase domains
MTNDFKEEVCRYALIDAKVTLALFVNNRHKMPLEEWTYSGMTREMGMRGVPVNMEKLKAAEAALTQECERTKKLIPWRDREIALLSLQAIRDECAKQGIRAPSSFAEKDPEGAAWEAEFADKYPWVRGVRDHRKANKHLKTVQTMISRTRPDGRMPYELKYFGATTGRDSGGGGWNAQNVPKGIVAGVDLRSLIEAPEGKTLIICDLAQIEARCLPYLAKDTDTLDLVRSGIDIYEAHARATMGYIDPRPLKEVNPKMRFLAKARVLGLGYGCGKDKFQLVAKILAGLDITPEDSAKIVTEYREQNPKITALWGRLDTALRQSTDPKDHTLTIPLPSGRELTYRDVRRNGDITALLPKNGKMMRCKLYGGLLTENATQAFARDVFMDRCDALERKGYEIILRVHDEVVLLVDEDKAKDMRDDVEAIMCEAPHWCSDLPLGAEAIISKCYMK